MNKQNLQIIPFLFLLSSFFCACAQRDDLNGICETLHVNVIHPRERLWLSPSTGLEAIFNPPSLLWPSKKNMTYSIRLSRDERFKAGSEIISGNLKWSMFNPHKRLDRGTWYWQVKTVNGEWSKPASFVITHETPELITPDAKTLIGKVPVDHPRILLQKEDASRLRNLENTPDAETIITEAKKYFDRDIPDENDGYSKRKVNDADQQRKLDMDASQELSTTVYEMIVSLTQAFILTGNNEFSEKAITIALEVSSWNPEGVATLSDFGDARCMLGMALVFDSFYDQLDKNQKNKLIQAITKKAESFYNDWINNIESKVLSGHVWQHILHYFFQTSLALYGEEPAAEEWLTYTYELFLARAPVLGGLDGGWVEGVSYFRMNMETMIDIPLFIKRYTGFDFINTHPWYIENIKWMVYHIPPGSSADGFGDNSEEVLMPGAEYIAYAQEIAKLTGNQLAAWYVKECRKYENPDLSKTKLLRWIRLTQTRDMVFSEIIEKPDLPMGMAFRDIGLAALHSNPFDTPTDIMVAFKSSPFGSYGHLLCDQNVFNILYGGKRFFFRTGYKVTMDDPHRTGWYRTTKSQNGILVNGQGQPYSCEAFGWISRFMHCNEIAYIKGDATNAYRSDKPADDPGVKIFFRHIVMLKPDLVIIYDELESKKDVQWSWLIHSLQKMSIDTVSHTFSVSLQNVKGTGKLYACHNVKWELSDTSDVPAKNWRESKQPDGTLKTYDDLQWHLKVSTHQKSKKCRFLSILKISPYAELDDPLLKDKPDEKGNVDITVGKWDISASLNVNLPPYLFIRKTDGNAAFSIYPKIIILNGKKFKGRINGSSKMVEIVNGKAMFLEAGDSIPLSVNEALKNMK